MFWKIVKNDFNRKKVITTAVFVFVTMAVILSASAINIIANLTQSISELKDRAVPADIAQMHAGKYDQSEIDNFTKQHQEHIAMQETMILLNIEGIDISFGQNETMAGTVQDISFVVQNKQFDFLLDLNNEKLSVKEGDVAVPIYFMVKHDLKIGDKLTVNLEGEQVEYVISDYVRDYEMNASIASSKRFVVNEADFDKIRESKTGDLEYIIEFKLKENGNAQAVLTAYIEAGLPSNGPSVGAMAFMLFNAMSDLAIAMIIILISILLIVISAYCIKLTFLATMDEDLREIGVMKAMGISRNDIKKVYLTKYKVMSIIAGVIGYLLSFPVANLFNGNIKLYLSASSTGNLQYGLALVAPLLVYLMIVMYCKKVLGSIDKISAVEALRADIMDKGKNPKYYFPLLKNRFMSTNIYMGIRDVWKRFRLYRLLLFIFTVIMFIVILPLNVFNTMNSPDFSTYMGIGKSDMRIDLRKSETISEDFLKLQEDLRNDSEIQKSAAYVTCYYQAKNPEGSWDYISIETGDFSIFQLNYLEGRAPISDGEISLSFANASTDGLDKKLGDEVIVLVNGVEKTLKVSGIYQDITNGGKTAKAHTSLGLNEEAILWYIVYIDVATGVDIKSKMDFYQNAYATAQVNDIQEYTRQTLGNLIDQMGLVVIAGMTIALIIATLITALFLKMLLSKDMSQIAIMRSMGVTSRKIKQQYMAGTLVILAFGIIFGVLASTFLGEFMVSLAMSSMGAARIQFVDIAWQTWLVCPLVMFAVVGSTVSICCNMTVKEDISVVLRG